MIDNDDDV